MQRYASLLVLALTGSACGGSNGDPGLANQASKAEATESFAALYEDIFVPHHCTGCHDSKAPGQLDLSTAAGSYEQLVGVEAAGSACVAAGTLRVDPGHPDDSLLVQKLMGHDADGQPVCGQRMPQKVALSSDEIVRVRSWVESGAPNN
jgi:hypothetical protein